MPKAPPRADAVGLGWEVTDERFLWSASLRGQWRTSDLASFRTLDLDDCSCQSNSTRCFLQGTSKALSTILLTRPANCLPPYSWLKLQLPNACFLGWSYCEQLGVILLILLSWLFLVQPLLLHCFYIHIFGWCCITSCISFMSFLFGCFLKNSFTNSFVACYWGIIKLILFLVVDEFM